MENVSEHSQELSKKFDTLIQNAYKTIVKCTKTAQGFPTQHENSLLIASPNYISDVASTSEKVMSLVDKLLKSQSISKSMSKLYLEGQKDILVEANDKLLESINSRIDLMTGTKTSNALPNEPKIVKESWNKNTKNSNVWQEVNVKKIKSFNIFNSGANIIDRPQLKFQDKVDNSYDTIFEPILKEKPNALKPLSVLLEKYDAVESYNHPYEYELDLFVPKEKFLSCQDSQDPLPLSDTSLILLEEPAQVNQLLKDLKKENEFAVDLEYHNYRSFQGYTCLMQISTRTQDYIVDTLKLRGHLEILNQVFTNPNILKVFHGGESDIKWLQKDFGIYVVNMFDTHQACKFLPFPRQSLAYLLKHYCGVDSDKTFQLFDWRLRPLPEQAITYARSDTHYLLYVYDCMKKDLTDASHGKQNLLMSTFTNSTNICKVRYNKPVFFEDGFMNIFRSHGLLTNQQKYALRELYKWRDQTARAMDESTGYILPNHMLLQIAQSIPRDVQGIFACCNPVPLPVKEHSLTIHAIILKARLQPLTKTIETVKPQNGAVKIEKKIVIPPHDTMDSQYYKGLPPVFTEKLSLNNQTILTDVKETNEHLKAQIGLFFEENSKSKSKQYIKVKLKTSRFETPYRRFLMSKEYAKCLKEKQEKEQKEKEEKAKQNQIKNPTSSSEIKIEKTPEDVNPKKRKIALKQVKCEEAVEIEKQKRKLFKKKSEEEGEGIKLIEPALKKIKTENQPVENKTKSPMKTNSEDNNRGNKSIPIVDYSKVNYNKYMVNNGKKGKGAKNGKKKR